jgi:hypothetical protein
MKQVRCGSWKCAVAGPLRGLRRHGGIHRFTRSHSSSGMAALLSALEDVSDCGFGFADPFGQERRAVHDLNMGAALASDGASEQGLSRTWRAGEEPPLTSGSARRNWLRRDPNLTHCRAGLHEPTRRRVLPARRQDQDREAAVLRLKDCPTTARRSPRGKRPSRTRQTTGPQGPPATRRSAAHPGISTSTCSTAVALAVTGTCDQGEQKDREPRAYAWCGHGGESQDGRSSHRTSWCSRRRLRLSIYLNASVLLAKAT